MFKKCLAILLCIAIVLPSFQVTNVYAEAEQNNNRQVRASESVKPITIKWVLEQFQVTEEWLYKQIASGHSLYNIYKALLDQKQGRGDADEILNNASVIEPIIWDAGEEPKEVYSKTSQHQLVEVEAGQPAFASASYDEPALQHHKLRNETSSYEIGYGQDSISTTTGDLYVQSVDIVLPGTIPFALVRKYDSALASQEMGVEKDAQSGQYRNAVKVRREEASSALGRGWRWDLPYLQTDNGNKYLYVPGIGTYQLGTDLSLLGYGLKNVLVKVDASQSVSGIPSAYKLSVLNGYDYFLDANGYLILIKDNYGNKVEFAYNTNDGNKVLSSISNNDGNKLIFTYSTNQVIVQQSGTERKYTYNKGQEEGRTVLNQVVDPAGRSTKYIYYFPESRFNFLPDLVNDIDNQGMNEYAMLTRIVHPSSAFTTIDYVAKRKQIGAYASEFVYKVRSREDSYASMEGEVKLHPIKLEYSNEDLESFGKDAVWTTKVISEQLTEQYRIKKAYASPNQPDLHVMERVQISDGTTEMDRSMTYDMAAKHNLPLRIEETTSQNGASTKAESISYSYDDKGLLLSEKLSTGQESTIQYQTGSTPYYWSRPSQILTKILPALNQNRVTVLKYDDKGSVTNHSVHEGASSNKAIASSEYRYDSIGNVSTSIVYDDGRLIITSFGYESPYGKSLVTSRGLNVTDADGSKNMITTRFEYLPTAQLNKVVDDRGIAEQYQYDRLGRMLQLIYPDGTSITNVYDDSNNEVTTTAPDGIMTVQRYNPVGMLAEEQNGQARYKYTYDKRGNLISQSDAEDNKTQFRYDAFGRPIETQYADQTKDRIDYDLINRKLTYTDAAGNQSRETYDSLWRVIAMEENTGNGYNITSKLTYNLAGNVLNNEDAKGKQVKFGYDVLGRLRSVEDRDGKLTSYAYSQGGFLKEVSSSNNMRDLLNYDELGRLTKYTRSGGTEKFYYDESNNLKKFVNKAGQATEYSYDQNNLLKTMKTADETVDYSYDSNGSITAMKDRHGVTGYQYDADDGMLIGISYPDGTKLDYERNSQQHTGYTLTGADKQVMRVQGQLNEMNQVSELQVYGGNANSKGLNAAANTPLDRFTFEYSPNQQMKRQANGKGLSTDYSFNGYDLTGLSNNGAPSDQKFNYQYDVNKNITGITSGNQVSEFTYDALNRILSVKDQNTDDTYTYDAIGNRTGLINKTVSGMKNASYSFDLLNRLTQVKGGNGKEVNYAYSGDGLLYERATKEKRTRYYYDASANLVAEAEVGTDGKPSIAYAYIYDVQGKLWARQDMKSKELQYYRFNGHGDVVALLDSAGKELNTYTYDIWGNPETEKEQVPNIFRYSGEYWDSETGLQYLRARWYDPSQGRFMSEDMYAGNLTNPLSMNRYSYVENNPLIYSDPSGNYCVSVDGKYAHTGQCADQSNADYYMDDRIVMAYILPYMSAGVVKGFYNNKAQIEYLSPKEQTRQTFWETYSKAEFNKMQLELPLTDAEYMFATVTNNSLSTKGLPKFSAKNKPSVKVGKNSGCNCFTAGTKVQTDDGEKNIEDIEVGDLVLAKDENNPDGELAYKEVTNLYRNQRDDIVKLNVGEQIIETTDNHPFWVEGKGWVFADELQVGDELQRADGSNLTIDKVEFVKLDEPITVYNFTVADYHTYYVTDLGIWVHNTKCGWVRMTTKQATNAAKKLGFEPTKFTAKTKEKIFYNKKTKTYISQDIGSGNGLGPHNGGVWKQATTAERLNSRDTRMGTYDANLNRVGD